VNYFVSFAYQFDSTAVYKQLRFIILFFGMYFGMHSMAQSVLSFSESGLKSAFVQAKQQNKPVMLWCYATWCPHCKYMKAEVFSNQSVADYFNKNFICTAQDMEKGEGIDLNKDIKISSFPTFIFYSPSGEMLYRVEGELKTATFIAEGKNALNPVKQFPFLKRQFEKDVSNSVNCYTYVRALRKAGMDVKTVVNQYFATQNDKQLLSEINWRIFTNGVSDFNSREFKFVIAHQKEYADIASPERVRAKLNFEVKSLLSLLVETTDTINYPVKRKLAAQIHSYSTDSLLFNYDLQFYESTRNWQKYCETCLQSVKNYCWNNHTQLFDIATNFLKNIPTPEYLVQAEQWAQRSLSLNEKYDSYMLCARILKKLNNQSDALKMAEKAKNMARKFGWEGTEALDFIKSCQ